MRFAPVSQTHARAIRRRICPFRQVEPEARGAVTRASGKVQAVRHPPAPGSRGKLTESNGRRGTVPAAADSLIPSAVRGAQSSPSRLEAGCGADRAASVAGTRAAAPPRPFVGCNMTRVVPRIRCGGTRFEEGDGRLGVVEHVHDARGCAYRNIPDRQTHRRAESNVGPAPLRSARDRRGPSGPAGCRRLVRVYCETSLPRPAKPRQAMPSPAPPRHAKPRQIQPPDAAFKQRPAARSPP